jgi:hypothetical protein
MRRVLAVMLVTSLLLAIVPFTLPTLAAAQYGWQERDEGGCGWRQLQGNAGQGYAVLECCTTGGPGYSCTMIELYCVLC